MASLFKVCFQNHVFDLGLCFNNANSRFPYVAAQFKTAVLKSHFMMLKRLQNIPSHFKLIVFCMNYFLNLKIKMVYDFLYCLAVTLLHGGSF